MKLAILCGGNPQLENKKPLKGIENSLKAVSGVLNNNGWEVIPHFTASTERNFTEKIKNHIEAKSIDINTIEQIVFFYTGHGIYGNSYSQEDFKIIWEEQKITISSIIGLLNETLNTLDNKTKIGLIIDACYSGDALKERNRDDYIEILTSTQDGKKTFEDEFDGKIISIFSHTFAKIFEQPNQQDEISIRDIKEYINNPDNNIEDLNVYYGEALKSDSIVLGNNKELNDIRDILESHYKDNIKKLKDDFLTYLLQDALSFNEINNCDDIDRLIQYLFENKECLYCILKDKNPQIIKKYESILKETNCEERKEEDSLKQIVFLIGNGQTGDANSLKYDVESYWITEKNRVRLEETKEKVNFSIKSEYESIICEFINNIEKQQISANTVEIVFILPKELHNINFSKIELNDEELAEEYDILIQLYDRYSHVDKETIHKYILRWKANSNRYKQNRQKSIEQQYLFTITNNAECKGFGKKYNRRGSQAVCLVSSVTLTSYIETFFSFGLPIVVFPWNDNPFVITTSFKVEEIKYNLLEYFSGNGSNYYFLYDLYHETKELKEKIEQSQDDYT